MTNKFLLLGAITAGAIGVGAADAATLATEGFVRSAVDYATNYTDTEIGKLSVPDDTNIVHKTGYEVISGDKEFDGTTTFTAPVRLSTIEGINAGSDLIAEGVNGLPYFPNGASMDGNTLTNVGAPSTGGDAANKEYVDNAVAAIDIAGAIDVSGKADLQTSATAGNIATINGAGQYVDSGNSMANVLSDISGLDTTVGNLATNKQDKIVGGAGQILVGTGTGFTWTATTGDTFTPIP